MKRLHLLMSVLIGFLLWGASAQAQSCTQYTQGQTPPFELGLVCTFTASSTPFGAFKTNGIVFWQVSWVPSGTISSASLSLDSSTSGAGGSWTTGGIIAAGTIGSLASAGHYGPNGTATTPSNYGQLTPTISGSGSITVTLLGYSESPAGGSSFPVSSAQSVSTGGSILPTGIGENFSNQIVAPDFNAQAPSVTVSGTGGSLIGGHGGVFAYTYTNDGTHETLPSATLQAGYTVLNAACTGSTCTATIVSPAAYSGFTGWNAYYLDYSTYTGQTPEKVAACTNVAIGTNCTITSAVSGGATPPTIASVPLQPTNAQATTCAPQVNPISIWAQAANGNWYTEAGVNPSLPLPASVTRTVPTLTFCEPVFFDDMQQNNPYGSNSFIGIFHRAGTNTSSGGQERALGLNLQVGSSTSPITGTVYGEEGIQDELDFYCSTCTVNGNPDGEVTAVSAQLGDFHTGTISDPILGINAIRAEVYRESGAGTASGTAPWSAIRAIGVNLSTVAGGSAYMSTVDSQCTDGSGGASGMYCLDFYGHPPSPTFTGAYVFRSDDSGSGSGFYNFYSVASTEEQGKNSFLGKTGLEHVVSAQPQNNFTIGTCAVTGAGTGASCALGSQAADSMGTMVITTGTSPSATGTITLTFHTAFASPQLKVHCNFTAENDALSWTAPVTFIQSAPGLSTAVANWTNGASLTASTSNGYDVNYWCWAN